MRLRDVTLAICLAGLSSPVVAQPSYWGRVTNLDSGTFYMETTVNRAESSGVYLQPPPSVFDINGVRGSYRVMISGGEAALPAVQAWLPELCGALGRVVAQTTYRSRARSIVAEVTCG
jgi:hypothetical protein